MPDALCTCAVCGARTPDKPLYGGRKYGYLLCLACEARLDGGDVAVVELASLPQRRHAFISRAAARHLLDADAEIVNYLTTEEWDGCPSV